MAAYLLDASGDDGRAKLSIGGPATGRTSGGMVDFVGVLVGTTAFITGFHSFLVHMTANRINEATDRVASRLANLQAKVMEMRPLGFAAAPEDGISIPLLEVIRHVGSVPRGEFALFRIGLTYYLNIAMLIATGAMLIAYRSAVVVPAVVLAGVQVLIVLMGALDEWHARKAIPWSTQLFSRRLTEIAKHLAKVADEALLVYALENVGKIEGYELQNWDRLEIISAKMEYFDDAAEYARGGAPIGQFEPFFTDEWLEVLSEIRRALQALWTESPYDDNDIDSLRAKAAEALSIWAATNSEDFVDTLDTSPASDDA